MSIDTEVINKDLDQEEPLSYLMAWLSPDRTYPTIGSKGISFAILNAWFSQSSAGPLLLIVDNQVAGSQAGYITYEDSPAGRPFLNQKPARLLFSTNTKQRVKHTVGGREHSILALGLIEGLFHQAADSNADAQINIQELSAYLGQILPAMSNGTVMLHARAMQSGFGNATLTNRVLAVPGSASVYQHMASYGDRGANYPRPTATLGVLADPPGKLYLDGELMGTTPLSGMVVPAGELTLEVPVRILRYVAPQCLSFPRRQ